MTMVFRYLFISSFLIISASTLLAQSPWVDDKGSIYAQLSVTSITYDAIFNNDSEGTQNSFDTSDRTIGLFAAYSLTDRTGIQIDLPYKAVSAEDNSLSALGDISVKLKHELFKEFPLTAFAGYTAPTATRDGALRTGFEQHGVDLGLSTGFSRNSTFGYFGAGHRYRSDIPNQIIIDTEIGTKANIGKKDLYLIFHIDGALNLTETTDPEADATVLYHNNGQYLSPGIKLSLNVVNNWWVNFGTYGAITATNQGAAPSLSLGIAYSKKTFE